MKLLDALKTKYPEGSVGGQCAVFAEQVVSFGPVGDSYASKKQYVIFNGITKANIPEIGKGYRAGDVLITSEGTFLGIGNGHVCILLDPVSMTVAESNFNKDGKIHYGRKVPVDKIYGVIRAPLLLDLGVCEINYNVFINNQTWAVGFLEDLSKQMGEWTGGKLKVNFFPLLTRCNNWWYESIYFPFGDYKFISVIAKSYFDSQIIPLSFTSQNQPAHLVAFIVRPDQWQGSILNHPELQELGYTNATTKPAQIQIQSNEFDMSPWYAGMRLINHVLPHELAHSLYWVNGLNDDTHKFDPVTKDLEHVFNNIDWNRVIANL